MTDKEFVQLTMAIKGFYPSVTTFNDTYVMEMWYDSLKDLDFNMAINAIKLYAQTNKFPPTIADIRECSTKISQPEEMGEIEAWAYVSRAIKNGTYGFEEEYKRLPVPIQQAIGNPSTIRDWALLPSDEVQTVAMSQFMRAYRNVSQRNKQVSRMSPDLQIAMNKTRLGIEDDSTM